MTYGFVATVSSLVILFVLGGMKLALSFISASASVDRIVDISGLLLCVAFIFPTTKISGSGVSRIWSWRGTRPKDRKKKLR